MDKERVKTNIFVNKYAKEEAKKIFAKYGLSLSDAINLFLFQSIHKKSIPFKIEIPNEETKKAIADARKRKNLEDVTIQELEEEANHIFKFKQG